MQQGLVQCQHAVQDYAPRATVAIREWVYGLELRVEERCLRHRRHVLAAPERHKVIKTSAHPCGMRRDERGAMGTVGGTAYPHLLVPQALFGDVCHECVVDVAYRIDADGPCWRRASRMAAMLPVIVRALAGALSVSSASATSRMLDVSRSIWELDEDSLLRSSAGRS